MKLRTFRNYKLVIFCSKIWVNIDFLQFQTSGQLENFHFHHFYLLKLPTSVIKKAYMGRDDMSKLYLKFCSGL